MKQKYIYDKIFCRNLNHMIVIQTVYTQKGLCLTFMFSGCFECFDTPLVTPLISCTDITKSCIRKQSFTPPIMFSCTITRCRNDYNRFNNILQEMKDIRCIHLPTIYLHQFIIIHIVYRLLLCYFFVDILNSIGRAWMNR